MTHKTYIQAMTQSQHPSASKSSLYTTPQSKQRILDLYQSKLDALNIDYDEQQVSTRFGDTHVIITGNPAHPPLVLVHGSNGCAPIALDVYPNLTKRYQVFAVDVIAQPNKSAETRPSMKDASYAHWLQDVIKHLNLSNVTLVGFSFGGFIIWKSLTHTPENIKEAYIIAPVGIINTNPINAMLNMFIPMKRYKQTRNPKHLTRVVHALFSEPDAFAFKYLAHVFTSFDMDFSPIPTITKAQAQRITVPLSIVAAKHDLMAPGVKLLRRAKRIFPNLKHTILLETSKHVQSRADNQTIETLICENAP